MATTIVTKNGSGAPTASDLVAGELAVDLTNGRLYTEDSGGTVLELGLNPSGNVDVTGGVTATGIIEASDGTNGEIQLGLGTALTTGAGTYDSSVRWNGSSGNLLFSQGAVEKMRITTTGIDVTGTVTADGLTVDADGNTNPVVLTHSNTGATLRFENTDQTTSDGQQLSRIEFSTDDAGTERDQIYLQMTGNGAGGAANFDVMTGNGTPVKRASFDVGGDVSFYEDTGTTAKLFWDASAESLGIGTSNPDTTLHLETPNGTKSEINFSQVAVTNYRIGVPASTDALTFVYGASTERMRIDSAGNLLVGCTSVPSASVAGFAVRDLSNGWIHVANDSTNIRSIAIFYNPNGAVGGIQTSGSSVLFNTSSDQRLKDNIVDAPSASDEIDAIQVRSFDWKVDGSHQKYGMVAQELQTVAPEAVSGDADSEEMMGVDYSKLVPMMLKEIQSLRARVAQLES